MKINNPTQNRFQYLLEFKQTERKWHFPFLAALCIGSCLFIGYFLGKPNYGALSSLGALTILYFTSAPITQRMIHLAICAFGIIFSFTISSFFGFNIYFAAFSVGIISFLAHFISSYFKIPPPGNFFFIMVAAMASTYEFDLELIPTRVGLVAMGAILSCSLAFLYSVFIEKSKVVTVPRRAFSKRRYTKFVESTIIGFFMALTLIIGHLLQFENTYWISIAAVAIIQGRNFEHVRQRNMHRILGTFIGIGFAWLILLFEPEKIVMIIIITILQFFVELLVVRNYGFAVVFITPLTLLLAETGSEIHHNVENLMHARLIDTIIGSLIGLAAGFFLHHQQIINNLEKNIRFSYFQFKKLKK
ncbi:Fusaric acid resistance protein-like [Chryseobacterium arachidis]|uniref:Fusaric acid resistance protein-like n=1 Tax=Chryseobacterium arachidis TaxID=1416778 RepID=A0A1M5CVH2_9FLAO|nr:FUSC family protein [Chryseobacterium arachidis]SHF58689.1 Fusaric acid resistance protein-like [Chryseobacterium arachidis]